MFINWSIGHELYFGDVMNPTHEIFRKFTDIVDKVIERSGVVAVHVSHSLQMLQFPETGH